MSYHSVVVTRRGGPEVLQIVASPLREPVPGEVRIKVLATGVGRTDINYRYGYSPFSPKVPFVPGYEIVGVVDAVGDPGRSRFKVGDRVAALTGHGGYAEVIYLREEHLVSVPASLDPAEVATLILNYVTAYHMLHRVAKVKAGDKALVIGASGGVGTALLELGILAGIKIYGTASSQKHALLTGLGAIPIDYSTQNFVEVIRQAEPGGLDFVFDGMGGDIGDRGLEVLRRGGKLVGYAAPVGFVPLLRSAIQLALVNLLPNGKSAEFYGIYAWYLRDKKPFMEDLPRLFKLLEEGKIRPVIDQRFPILEAARANALLESGQVRGNLVLIAPEFS
ncbi:MAG TPA: medium chain dehydrogenase/reductase family protein [Anaerolineaceae bacterium]|nr:medium chain dehydrogenase/reductase family protein [Anaerolineaceae bacterium]